jgi:hypothetical protein
MRQAVEQMQAYLKQGNNSHHNGSVDHPVDQIAE